ncbi:hypothetical protein PXK30_09685 [Phaeobacter gallaeciensis]|uniref:hypothetical protein n=1 Tax=Phaeobacter gallaeciensis TaxID=60890 RepID=UPI00237F44A1|nr:hypothetical protein [Phaeobacter gallaeciensis]MDE4303606.1 hypothetical protein [Phaeobacter gallaeciensis]MDE4307912.1 hypothetical protein [Phaeobacter gallaeciensis]MDE4312370.1 hypothetical protein [Phaeobacter gallaeciensis]MDE4316841.1 hypothetical protein [Phaeobacter gallaeciensis]MDE4321304.1 hypothetical protein [Phaeobacter gallaeciensis]
MLDRRGILRLLGGGLVTSATVDPKTIAKEIAASSGAGLTASGGGGIAPIGNGLSECGIASQTMGRGVSDLFNALYRKADGDRNDQRHIPEHIASKKSWSQAFKLAETRREHAEIQELIRRLESDHDLAARLAKKLGFA